MPSSDLFITALKQNPVLVVLFIVMDILVLTVSFQVFASSESVDQKFSAIQTKLSAQESDIKAIAQRVDRWARDQEISDIEREIFSLERIEQSGEATNRDLDRLDTLKIKLEQKLRNLEELNS